jgi:hypothetical protein
MCLVSAKAMTSLTLVSASSMDFSGTPEYWLLSSCSRRATRRRCAMIRVSSLYSVLRRVMGGILLEFYRSETWVGRR